ncbi:MAG: hypothetical protein ACKPKO_09160, partial [Candidatus Fonsibacter sp.]
MVYGGRRVIRVGQACALPVRTTTAILAGCSNANTFLKAALLVGTYERVSLYLMVDDTTVTASGSKARVERSVGVAGRRLMTDLEDELGARVNSDKSYVATTASDIAKGIQRRLGNKFKVKRAT